MSGSDESGCCGEKECGVKEEVECVDVRSYFLEYHSHKQSEPAGLEEGEGEGEQAGPEDTGEGVGESRHLPLMYWRL